MLQLQQLTTDWLTLDLCCCAIIVGTAISMNSAENTFSELLDKSRYLAMAAYHTVIA
jgi:ABC-type arginine transport system permease subunit